jgi:hypothetical protein
MLALVILDTVVVAVLTVLVVGLLRSHADILVALHRLGAGVGDPAGDTSPTVSTVNFSRPDGVGVPLPAERDDFSVHDLAGVDPGGAAVAVSLRAAPRTVVAFLSSGCTTCAGFWQALRQGELALPGDPRVVVVTKGPEAEVPAEVGRLAGPRPEVLLSTSAWMDYEVPGSPFFVVVDGPAGRRMGEGVATNPEQLRSMLTRADLEAGAPGPSRSRPMSGPAREVANDQALMAAGILPGDPSLYGRRAQPDDGAPERG